VAAVGSDGFGPGTPGGLLTEAFLKDAAVGVVFCTADGRFSRVNPRFCELVGYSEAELLRMRLAELNHPDDVKREVGLLEELFRGARSEAVFEKRYVQKGGGVIWVSVIVSLRHADDGTLAGVMGVVRDVTERRRAQAELLERDARLEAIFNHAPAQMLLISARPHEKFKVLAVNAPFIRVAARFGVTDERALIGRDVFEAVKLMGLPEEGAVRLKKRLERAIDTKVTVVEATVMQTAVGPFHAEYSAIPILDAEGQVTDVLSLSRETTAEQQAQAQLREALRTTETLLREIHHRVKNNLQLVSSLLSLQRHDTGDERSREVLDVARARVHAVALVHESLYRAGNVGELDFIAHARAVVRQLVPVGSAGRVEVVSTAERLPLSLQVAVPLGLILNELLTNALKHSGATSPRVEVRCEVDADQVSLLVGDDGPGFPPEFRLESATSLGLKIVTALAGQLGGSVFLEPGPGGRVRVRFPRREDPPD
jgi:PAS domain S-box-containing protein